MLFALVLLCAWATVHCFLGACELLRKRRIRRGLRRGDRVIVDGERATVLASTPIVTAVRYRIDGVDMRRLVLTEQLR